MEISRSAVLQDALDSAADRPGAAQDPGKNGAPIWLPAQDIPMKDPVLRQQPPHRPADRRQHRRALRLRRRHHARPTRPLRHRHGLQPRPVHRQPPRGLPQRHVRRQRRELVAGERPMATVQHRPPFRRFRMSAANPATAIAIVSWGLRVRRYL